MVIKITFPYKDSLSTISYNSCVIQTDDKQLINRLESTKNPIEIGVILSENEEKFKKINEDVKEDKEIIIDEVLANPDLRINLP
jgi:ApbE superfamily uncharacterized protein (UPF0280 family)